MSSTTNDEDFLNLLTGSMCPVETKRTIWIKNCQCDLWLVHCPVTEWEPGNRMISSQLGPSVIKRSARALAEKYYDNCILFALDRQAAPPQHKAGIAQTKPDAKGSEISPQAIGKHTHTLSHSHTLYFLLTCGRNLQVSTYSSAPTPPPPSSLLSRKYRKYLHIILFDTHPSLALLLVCVFEVVQCNLPSCAKECTSPGL
jgi:hypothetical protein